MREFALANLNREIWYLERRLSPTFSVKNGNSGLIEKGLVESRRYWDPTRANYKHYMARQ